MKVIFKMPFLTFSKVKVDFVIKELIWKAYTITEILSTTKRVHIISLKEFAKTALDPEQEAFMIYVTTLFKPMKMHLDQEIQIAALITDKALVTILAKYSDFEIVFSKKSAAVLLEHIKINTHVINLDEDK